MPPDPAGSAYYRDPVEIAAAHGLSHLGTLGGVLRAPDLTRNLADLAPDPRLTQRLLGFVGADLPLVWVVGLGDAGEEIPVAVGLADRFAAAGKTPVLLVRPGEVARANGDPVTGRPVETVAHFRETLQALMPDGFAASATGIQGVYRAWPGARGEGEALWPAAVVIAARHEEGAPIPPHATHMVLVVPYRDQPRERIDAAIRSLRAGPSPVVGFVAFESAADPLPAPPAPELPAQEPAGRGVPAAAQEQIAVAAPWTDSFGPRGRRRGRTRAARAPRTTRLGWVAIGGTLLIVCAIAAYQILRPVRGPAYHTVPPRAAATAGDDVPPQPGLTAAIADTSEPGSAPRPQPPDTLAPAGGAQTVDSSAATAQFDSSLWGFVPESAASASASAAAAAAPAPAPDTPASSAVTAAENEGAPADAIRDMVPERGGPFAVLCGSYRSQDGAAREAARLTALGYEVRRVGVRIPEQGVWQRVLVGRCDDETAAREFAQAMVDAGALPDCRVVSADGIGLAIGSSIGPNRGQ
jgi:cell division protein FtsN